MADLILPGDLVKVHSGTYVMIRLDDRVDNTHKLFKLDSTEVALVLYSSGSIGLNHFEVCKIFVRHKECWVYNSYCDKI